jgi:hypothetical protein
LSSDRASYETDLERRQGRLQAEAEQLLADLDLAALLAHIGPIRMAGSFVSGLMTWREVDVGVCAGSDFGPEQVLNILARLVGRNDVIGFDYRDERGPRSPTGTSKDERYHVPILVQRASGVWRVDLTIWLNHDHANVTAWHEWLREVLTPDQRAAILQIKTTWHDRPEYPDNVGGQDVYTAVIDHQVRTPAQFAAWLDDRPR